MGMPPALFCDSSILEGSVSSVSLKWNAVETTVVIRRLVDLLKRNTAQQCLGDSAVQSASVLRVTAMQAGK